LRPDAVWFDPRACIRYDVFAGWSSLVARRAHNPEVVGSNPTPATSSDTWFLCRRPSECSAFFLCSGLRALTSRADNFYEPRNFGGAPDRTSLVQIQRRSHPIISEQVPVNINNRSVVSYVIDFKDDQSFGEAHGLFGTES
jgi:hypothetical protein